jgi:myo-inositol-1(or 4)-monophosphatase
MAVTSPIMTIMMRASEKAARSLIRDFNEVEHLQVSRKGPGDFVSAADRRSEELIFEELSKARPDYAFLMEESGAKGNQNSEYRWIIDPLDGTSNFLHGLPHWCISIALEHKGEIVAGLVHDPVKDEIFHAEKGKGSFMRRRRLRISGRDNAEVSMVAIGQPGHAKAKREKFNAEYNALQIAGYGLRRFGAAALDLSYVAAGRFDAYWERGIKSWDIAAGYLIVKESGGFISDVDDRNKNPIDTGSVLATNEQLYEPIKKVLKTAS